MENSHKTSTTRRNGSQGGIQMSPHVLRLFSIYGSIFNEGNILKHSCCMKWKALMQMAIYQIYYLSLFFCFRNGNGNEKINALKTFAWRSLEMSSEMEMRMQSFQQASSFQTSFSALTIFSATLWLRISVRLHNFLTHPSSLSQWKIIICSPSICQLAAFSFQQFLSRNKKLNNKNELREAVSLQPL